MANQTKAAILGATAGLGQALARQLAQGGNDLVLLARDSNKLEAVAVDVRERSSVNVDAQVADFDQLDSHEGIASSLSDVDVVYCVYGTLPDQELCEQDWDAAYAALHTNAISVISLVGRLANTFETRGSGTLVVVSSVAGDRGRKSNYIYGTAKGALSIFCEGLRNRLYGTGVHVVSVKPGFIDTPMTAHIEKKPAVLWVDADKVASDIIRAVAAGKNNVYTPWFWRYILLIITHIPEFIFKRLSL